MRKYIGGDGTAGGFEASFAFEPDQLRSIADSVKDAAGENRRPRVN